MTPSTLELASEKASTLVEALPYIKNYRDSRVVVKVGGAALDDPDHGISVAEDIALMTLVGIDVIVVHGGGPQITRALEAAGAQSRFVEGLRVTDEASMEIVAQTLTGAITPSLVSRLNSAGVKAVGLSGLDGGLLEAVPLDGLGRVGRISAVNEDILEGLLAKDYVPVVASVAPDAEGRLTNVNADEVAGAVANAVGAAKLVYLTNVEGLYGDLGDSGTLISEVSAAELRSMLDGLTAGMKPKIRSALSALEGGVGKVHILDGRVPHALLLEVFTDEGIGTQVIA